MSASAEQTPWSLILARKAVEVTEFILAHRGRTFPGWRVPLIWQYAFWHLAQGTAFVVRAEGRIVALAFVWGAPAEQIRARAATGQPAFQWEQSQDSAEAVLVAEVIGDRNYLPRLYQQAQRRWPDLERKTLFTYRAGSLVELTPAIVSVMVRKDAHGRR
jgi:hypothetical protein